MTQLFTPLRRRAHTHQATRTYVLLQRFGVPFDFERDRIRVGDGEQPAPRIRIAGDEDAILALTRVPFRGPVPKAWSSGGRQALKRQLGGELTIRGLLLRSPSVLRLLRLLSA